MSAAALLERTVEEVPPGSLERQLASGRPLRVKLGVDPTAPDIHLGHTLALRKLREFQDAGHLAVLIIGDWTARVGDPSGRSSTRPMLAADEIEANAATYRAQVDRILDPDRTEVRRNGEWFAGMGLEELFRLSSRATVNQLLRRNDFGERIGREEPISVLELLYPLMQAFDSVAVQADIELGGTDQLFNLMLGREIQEAYGQSPQTAITLPILPGTDGVKRMSKSAGNYVGVSEPPEEQFGKVMRLPDDALSEWYRLLEPDAPPPAGHLGDEKRRLARLIVDRFHDVGSGERAEEHFNRVIRDRSVPDEVPSASVRGADSIHLPEVLVSALGVSSRSEARRLIAQGGVSIDGDPVSELDLTPDRLDGAVLRVGKRRFARIEIVP